MEFPLGRREAVSSSSSSAAGAAAGCCCASLYCIAVTCDGKSRPVGAIQTLSTCVLLPLARFLLTRRQPSPNSGQGSPWADVSAICATGCSGAAAGDLPLPFAVRPLAALLLLPACSLLFKLCGAALSLATLSSSLCSVQMASAPFGAGSWPLPPLALAAHAASAWSCVAYITAHTPEPTRMHSRTSPCAPSVESIVASVVAAGTP